MPPIPPREGWALTRRSLIGALIVVLLTAAVTVTAILNEVTKLAGSLRQNPTIPVPHGVLTPASAGQAQTLLLVGDDRRPAPKGRPGGFVVPHSNEMLLVRLDPGKPTISMLSIPRDLKVTIRPDNGQPTVKRINVAYTLGGIQLMTKTIKQVTGLDINHVVVITFPRFKRAVDQMGCVYSTIDHRYFHSNSAGGQQYFEVNLQPGYQQLCGTHALEFVAYRHGDTALIRDARDQRFLLDAKAQYGPGLISNRAKFERIFGGAVQTDIHTNTQVLDLLELLIGVSGKPVRQAHFDANIGPVFVTASRRQIQGSVDAFLRGTAAQPGTRIAAAVRTSRKRRRARRNLFLVPTPSSAIAEARTVAAGLPFALEYPRVLNQYGGAQPNTLRVYGIRDPHGHTHVAYNIAVDRGKLGEVFDVQGTGWQDPPLLDNPTQAVRIGARSYGLYYEGDNLRVVAWKEGKATYWISNTLTDSVPPAEMLAMAAQTTSVTGPGVVADTRPRNFVVPNRVAKARNLGALTKVGATVGLVTLLLVALMSVKLFQRAQSLRHLRGELEDMQRRAAALRARAARPPPSRVALPASAVGAPPASTVGTPHSPADTSGR